MLDLSTNHLNLVAGDRVVVTIGGHQVNGRVTAVTIDGAWTLLDDGMEVHAVWRRLARRPKLGLHVAKLAMQLMKRYEADYADYQAECAADRANGHGAHYCEHGADRWTDYDNICGACEDGLTMSDPYQRRVRALAEAQYRDARQSEIIHLLVKADELNLSRALDSKMVVEVAVRLITV